MMIYLGNNGTLSTFELMKANGWGNVLLANRWRYPKPGIKWFLDNGAYSCYVNNTDFDDRAFFGVFDKIEYSCSYPDFVVVPDIVAGGYESLRFSLEWLPIIPGGYNCYLAVQDDMELDVIEKYIGLFDGLFVGGSLKWKMRTSENWIKLAHQHGLKCHIGKVGTFKRLVWAKKIGADSIDSSTFVQARAGSGFKRIEAAKLQTALY